MKKYFQITAVSVFLLVLLSCGALPANYSSGQSWFIPSADFKRSGRAWTTLTILSVNVDRSGGWDSIEKETAALAPIYFWEKRCRVVPADEAPSYAAQIYIRERELSAGLKTWKTKKSLTIEVHIWDYDNAPNNGDSIIDYKLPAAVGRLILIGDKSLISSKIASRLLPKVINKAVRKLAVYERRKRKGKKDE
jgi:hypothetical protein